MGFWQFFGPPAPPPKPQPPPPLRVVLEVKGAEVAPTGCPYCGGGMTWRDDPDATTRMCHGCGRRWRAAGDCPTCGQPLPLWINCATGLMERVDMINGTPVVVELREGTLDGPQKWFSAIGGGIKAALAKQGACDDTT